MSRQDWHAKINFLDGRFCIENHELGYLLDAKTGQPVRLYESEVRPALHAMVNINPAKNKVVERVS